MGFEGTGTDMSGRGFEDWRGIPIAAAAVATACAATAATWPLLQPMPLGLFHGAVAVSAWAGRARGGAAAVVLSAVMAYFANFPPYLSFAGGAEQIVILGVFVAVSSLLVALIARLQDAAERERGQRLWFAATLASVGDAVIATDTGGRVMFLNRSAEALTGRRPDEAEGRPLGDVLRIVDVATRAPAVEPVGSALRSGGAVALAGGTALVAADGAETPIEGCTAPITDDRGEVRGVILAFRDATERRRAEQAAADLAETTASLALERVRLELALCGGGLGVYEWRPGDSDVWWSPEVYPLYGVDPATFRPTVDAFLGLVHPDDRDELMRKTEECIARRDVFIHEYRVVRPDGAVRWIANRSHVSLDDAGRVERITGVAADVTDRRRAEEAIRERSERLRENDRRKDEFLAMLAHELRNPLAAIGNAVSVATMIGGRDNEAWAMGVIGRQVGNLTRLIDDLTDVSRIHRGKVELRRVLTELTGVLESAAATARPFAEGRGHALELDLERGALWAEVDPTRLEQVVVNLLNNAAKYSDDGGLIRLSARREGGEIVVAVKDRGIGIPPERMPEMFELFAQGDRSRTRSEGGLGIGLTVVKKLAEMHGGRVEARSDGPGAGSEFTVRLPAAAPPEPSASGPEASGPGKKPARSS